MSIYADKRVLVTGGSGFIGTALCRELIEAGAEVWTTEHVNTPIFTHHCVPCDLEYAEMVRAAIYKSKPDFIFHLASQAIVTDGNNKPRDTFAVNTLGTVNLLSAILENRIHPQAIVIASTDKVYGRSQSLPYEEHFPLHGVNQIYEASKTCEDIVAQAYAKSYELPIAITRFGNVYGPGDGHTSRLIPGTINTLLHGEIPVIRSDGQHYRDFIYISDVVSGYMSLGEHCVKVSGYSKMFFPLIYNFGTGVPSRVLDVASMICERFGVQLKFDIQYGADDEIHQQYLDYSRAYRDFGWYPAVPLRNGLAETVDWYKENWRMNGI